MTPYQVKKFKKAIRRYGLLLLIVKKKYNLPSKEAAAIFAAGLLEGRQRRQPRKPSDG